MYSYWLRLPWSLCEAKAEVHPDGLKSFGQTIATTIESYAKNLIQDGLLIF